MFYVNLFMYAITCCAFLHETKVAHVCQSGTACFWLLVACRPPAVFLTAHRDVQLQSFAESEARMPSYLSDLNPLSLFQWLRSLVAFGQHLVNKILYNILGKAWEDLNDEREMLIIRAPGWIQVLARFCEPLCSPTLNAP